MSDKHVVETLLRPAVEFNSAIVSLCAASICEFSPWAVALNPTIGHGAAACFMVFGYRRFKQGYRIIRFRRNILRLPDYALTSAQIPVSQRNLFLGKGFAWEQKHTQRLHNCMSPEVAEYVKPPYWYQRARAMEKRFEHTLPWLTRLLSSHSRFNPVRPLPPVGGSSLIHGVELDEEDVTMPLADRVGHTLVVGTTRVGKTRLAEVLITQDILRYCNGKGNRDNREVVICFDPKGDSDLLIRMYLEAVRAGRENEFYVFHLGHPEISARYNAVGRFGRVSEVASRISGQLSSEGNSAAFKEFAWRFVNIIARAQVELGKRPDYPSIARYVQNIDELFIDYATHFFNQQNPEIWQLISQQAAKVNDKNTPRNLVGRDPRVVAIDKYLTLNNKIYDPILGGLYSAVKYDKTYFDKIVASLLPLLEKLTTGKIAELLAPNYNDLNDDRPIFSWEEVIRKRGIVYIGLDALSDTVVASAVGNSMFADLVSMAGHIYKHGLNSGLPGEVAGKSDKVKINLHCDEFNELMGDEFIPLINKGGGAGIQVTAYTQTVADIEARIGNRAKARQVVGNFNTLIMLRVREKETAALLAEQLPKVSVTESMVLSSVTDSSDPTSHEDFKSSTGDRVTNKDAPMLDTSNVIQLPKGQAFALLEGGKLWKIRMPLPKTAKNETVPKSIQQIADHMAQNYHTSESTWWNNDRVILKPDTVSAFEQLRWLEMDDTSEESALLRAESNEDISNDTNALSQMLNMNED